MATRLNRPWNCKSNEKEICHLVQKHGPFLHPETDLIYRWPYYRCIFYIFILCTSESQKLKNHPLIFGVSCWVLGSVVFVEMPGPSLSRGEQKNGKVLLPPKRGTRVGTCSVLKNHLTSREFLQICPFGIFGWTVIKTVANGFGRILAKPAGRETHTVCGWFTVLPWLFFVFLLIKVWCFRRLDSWKNPAFFTWISTNFERIRLDVGCDGQRPFLSPWMLPPFAT